MLLTGGLTAGVMAEWPRVVTAQGEVRGRVIAEPGTGVSFLIGVRVAAEPIGTPNPPGNRPRREAIFALVDQEDSFRMTGVSEGVYRFSVRADRPPFLVATRISVNGIEVPAASGVDVPAGASVVIFAARLLPNPSIVDRTLPSGALVDQFRRESNFGRQLDVARAIVERQDTSIVPAMVAWLKHQDRHIRGNAAFVFAGLGDARGFPVLTDILTDRSDRPDGQGVPTGSSNGRYQMALQIRADRYYAAHLLGELRDPRAVPILLPLLHDPEIGYKIPWALAQIGDQQAVGPLIDELRKDDPSTRVHVIDALETLHARAALPRLIELLSDHRTSRFGNQISVADAARRAIATFK